ncbi:enoyl-CoA hydratase/isomerase family protein [Actinomarinicola tropica]|uniref:Enoyl-CoA hydratase/isomerase family protein n=1 Tax=Actinomarinicola tropica TaxID=2789776 RepID=A0A5Q2RI67_9ACTN|nr:enoyl-CoA hydratase/isomerase family protein [Actinomarinicola tropica]QGG94261.1 enoyl-CoA hydratase/isomerase family protein [Actinomarinicola tropica]
MTEDASGLTIVETGRIVRVTLDRPERLNVLDDELRRAFADLLHELEDRPEVSVLVLTGAGRAFSAGADFRRTAYPPIDGDWVQRRHATGSWQRLLAQLDRIPQATVAALHGHVVGGGALLASAFDIRLAADDTLLRIPELAIGIPLTWAGIPLLVREVGLPTARDWIMTCRAVDAVELHRSGFASRLVPAAELDAALDRCVEELLAVPPGPLAMTRAMTAAIGRAHPAMLAGWGDADHQHWSFTEDEYRDAARAYARRLRRD